MPSDPGKCSGTSINGDPTAEATGSMDATAAEPTQELHGREALAPVFDNLNTYRTTTHFNGQSTVFLNGDRASGESYCRAHHISDGEGAERTIMIASIRYLDEFVKQDGEWLPTARMGRACPGGRSPAAGRPTTRPIRGSRP
ncbi:nuclear transport factor 2 family protein [Streptomyces venetus]|uniref:nuclear transport factor 2 family protein n=1 Tax=Streptomyces venetus TaxID=1701086 RepID=UPI003C2F9C40